MDGDSTTPHPAGVAFLLAQVGAHAAARFTDRLGEHSLNAPQAGALRLVGRGSATSQRALARRLGTAPSRVVALVDELEARGLVTRARSVRDRRVYEIELTRDGKRVLHDLSAVAGAHDEEITAPLDETERSELRQLLIKVADAAGLEPGVHPGYHEPQRG